MLLSFPYCTDFNISSFHLSETQSNLFALVTYLLMGEFCRLLVLPSDKKRINKKRCWLDRSGRTTTQLKPWHLTSSSSSSSSSCLTSTELYFRCYLRRNDSGNALNQLCRTHNWGTKKFDNLAHVYPKVKMPKTGLLVFSRSPPGNFSSLQGTYLSPSINKEVKERD